MGSGFILSFHKYNGCVSAECRLEARGIWPSLPTQGMQLAEDPQSLQKREKHIRCMYDWERAGGRPVAPQDLGSAVDLGWWWLRVPARTEPTPAPRAGLLPAQALLEGTPSQPQPTWGPGHPTGACLLSSSFSGLIAFGPP